MNLPHSKQTGILLDRAQQSCSSSPAQASAPWVVRRQVRPQRVLRSISEPLEIAIEEPAQVQPASPTPPQSLTDQVLSSDTIEGDPRKALKICEAYWTVRTKPPPPPLPDPNSSLPLLLVYSSAPQSLPGMISWHHQHRYLHVQ